MPSVTPAPLLPAAGAAPAAARPTAPVATEPTTTTSFSYDVTVGLGHAGLVDQVKTGLVEIGNGDNCQTQLQVVKGPGWLSRTYTLNGSYSGAPNDVVQASRTAESFVAYFEAAH